MSGFAPEQRKLMEILWRISEEAWSAGWKRDLDFEVWRIVQTGPAQYGGMRVGADLIGELSALSESAGGWIHYDPVEQETWVDANAWAGLFAAWSAENPPKSA
jgi:hypothetical protein